MVEEGTGWQRWDWRGRTDKEATGEAQVRNGESWTKAATTWMESFGRWNKNISVHFQKLPGKSSKREDSETHPQIIKFSTSGAGPYRLHYYKLPRSFWCRHWANSLGDTSSTDRLGNGLGMRLRKREELSLCPPSLTFMFPISSENCLIFFRKVSFPCSQSM